jgi:cyclophilin family peptidyl-prolyl cis-trans isomerase
MLKSRVAFALVGLVTAVGLLHAAPQPAQSPAPTVLVMNTVQGAVEIELLPDAPRSVTRVLELVKRNFYRGLRIHVAQPGLVQFGDPATRNMEQMSSWGYGGSGRRLGFAEPGKRPFTRGIVGLAFPASEGPEQADSQLFILKANNPSMNGKNAVVGRVTVGMDVVDKLRHADVIRNITFKAAS